jgi:SpoVK/Ycf46/Vps4 family AAA+-type ATPase
MLQPLTLRYYCFYYCTAIITCTQTREEILRVTMANNRVDPSVDFAAIAKDLEGFTGSDIKEVCREAVVRIAHEKAQVLTASTASIHAQQLYTPDSLVVLIFSVCARRERGYTVHSTLCAVARYYAPQTLLCITLF